LLVVPVSPDKGTEEFAERRRRALDAMVARGLDALLQFKQESMYWLTGYDTFGYSFFQCLVLRTDGDLVRSPGHQICAASGRPNPAAMKVASSAMTMPPFSSSCRALILLATAGGKPWMNETCG
jgi:Xaa-Pro aminopeptidase